MRTIEEFDLLWSKEVLKELSLKMDPEGDEAAQSAFKFMGPNRDNKRQYMRSLARFDHFEKPPANQLVALQPPKLSRYFRDQIEFNFSDIEKDQLNKASLFFEKNGPAIIMILATRSLLKQYSSTNTSELLGRTKLLTEFPHRRIIETMQFVMDVMEPDWFSTKKAWVDFDHGSPAVHSIQKLRLIHAMIRSRVLSGDMGDWNANELDAPINQEDMIMANYTFSLEIIEGLRNIGREVTIEEQDNFYQAWQVIGRLLGIDYPEGLMPETYEEAWHLQNKLYKKNFKGENKHSKILAEALIDWMEKIIPMTDRNSILQLILQINGEENRAVLEENLDLDFSNAGKSSGMLGWAINFFKAKSKIAQRTFFQELFNHVINSLLAEVRGGKERRFRITDAFERSWKLAPEGNYKPISQFKLFLKMVNAFIKTLGHRFLRIFGFKPR